MASQKAAPPASEQPEAAVEPAKSDVQAQIEAVKEKLRMASQQAASPASGQPEAAPAAPAKSDVQAQIEAVKEKLRMASQSAAPAPSEQSQAAAVAPGKSDVQAQIDALKEKLRMASQDAAPPASQQPDAAPAEPTKTAVQAQIEAVKEKLRMASQKAAPPASEQPEAAAAVPSKAASSDVLAQIQAVKDKLKAAAQNSAATPSEVVQAPAAPVAPSTPPADVPAKFDISSLQAKIAEVQANPPKTAEVVKKAGKGVKEAISSVSGTDPSASKAVAKVASEAASTGPNFAVIAVSIVAVLLFYLASQSFGTFVSALFTGTLGTDVPPRGKKLSAQQIFNRGILNLRSEPTGWFYGDEPSPLYSNLPPPKPPKMVKVRVKTKGFKDRFTWVPETQLPDYEPPEERLARKPVPADDYDDDDEDYDDDFDEDEVEATPAIPNQVLEKVAKPVAVVGEKLKEQQDKAAEVLEAQQAKAAKLVKAQTDAAAKKAEELRAQRERENAAFLAEAEVAWANSWEEPPKEQPQRSALDIFSEGLQNLQKEPTGWFFGKPSSLYSNLW